MRGGRNESLLLQELLLLPPPLLLPLQILCKGWVLGLGLG